jgi:hypothetical protein
MSLVQVEQVKWLYVVDYDIPTKNASRRVMFYQGVHRMLKKKFGEDVKFSTYSCYFTDDPDVAKKFLEIVQKYDGKGHIYKAVKMKNEEGSVNGAVGGVGMLVHRHTF